MAWLKTSQLLCFRCVQEESSLSISDDADSPSCRDDVGRSVTRRRLDFDESSSSSSSSLCIADVQLQEQNHPPPHHHHHYDHHQQQQQERKLKAEPADIKESSTIYRPWEVSKCMLGSIHQSINQSSSSSSSSSSSFINLPPTKEEVNAFSRVRFSVC